MKCWIVIMEIGEYSSRRDIPVRVFTDKKTAEDQITLLDNIADLPKILRECPDAIKKSVEMKTRAEMLRRYSDLGFADVVDGDSEVSWSLCECEMVKS